MIAEQEVIQKRIVSFVSEFTGVRSQKLTLASCLNDEIGMDGDDAVDFFKSYAEKFDVDLEELRLHWDQHFGPEGTSLSAMLVIFVPPWVIGFALNEIMQSGPSWKWFVGSYAVWWIFGFIYLRIRDKHKAIPITIEDLIQAAISKKWVKAYPPSP